MKRGKKIAFIFNTAAFYLLLVISFCLFLMKKGHVVGLELA
jgi:hypothetical protein